MDTRDLEYVVAVRHSGSIGKAAEALGISQPALTKAVRRVEEQLGLQLFERVPQGMRPTQAGELFLERAQKLRRDYDDAMAEMRCLLTGEQGMVRIGYSLTFPDQLLHIACKRLLRERPAAKLALLPHGPGTAERPASGDLDIVFVPIQAFEPDLDIQPLYQDRLVVAADADHPLCRRKQLRLEDLVGEDWPCRRAYHGTPHARRDLQPARPAGARHACGGGLQQPQRLPADRWQPHADPGPL